MANIFSKPGEENLNVSFGRFSDSYKPPETVKFWDQAVGFFDQKKYLEAYEAFLEYLRDDEVDNVKFTKSGNQIDFEFPQGSKKIFGSATDQKVGAEVRVAQVAKLSVAFMRRLLDLNYNLNYARTALKDDMICMKFDTTVIDGSPLKLYYAFKELATNADRIDDLLLEEFPILKAVDRGQLIDIPANEKETKCKYLQKWIKAVLDRIAGLNPDKLAGGISYLLLGLCYKIDYLVAPEGTLMRDLEKIHRLYFSREEKTYIEKNQTMIKEFDRLFKEPKENILKELYRVKSTFAIVNPVAHDEIASTIENELKNLPGIETTIIRTSRRLFSNTSLAIRSSITGCTGQPGSFSTYCSRFSMENILPNSALRHIIMMTSQENLIRTRSKRGLAGL